MANKSGSDGQIRKTTAEWATDTDTYLEGMRLMDTTTGEVRVSKGTTYALAWVPATGGGASAWGGITGTLSDQTDLQSALNEKIEIADIAPTATFSTTTNTAQDPGQDTVRFNSGTIASVTEIALSDVVGGVDKGDLNSRFSGIIQFRPVGTTDTIEFQITSVVHTSWTRYTVTYLKGTLPANGTVMAVRFLPSNTINAALAAALAGKGDGRFYMVNLSQSGTSDPTGVVIINQLSGSPALGYVSPGQYTITLVGAFPAAKTGCVITPCRDDSSSTAGIYRIDDDTIGVFTGSAADGTPGNDVLQGHTAWIIVAP